MILLIFIAVSVILSIILMPTIIAFCKKRELYDYQDERKIHSGNIPRLGGVGIVVSFFLATILYILFTKDIAATKHLPILIAGLIIFVFAIVDDIFNLPAIIKLIVQLIAVSIVTFNGYRFNQIMGWQLPTILSFALTFGWVLGVINAYNLIDGLDGLCGSLSISAVLTLGVLYLLSGNSEAGICFILAGAIFGFLCFNWPPAKLFMGDNGSQFLGFMISTIPLYTSSDVFEYNKFFIMIAITAFPVFDTVAAIWRRLRDKRPIMSADRSHLHHKLLNLGYTKQNALYLIAFLQTLVCISVIISYFLGTVKGSALLFETIAFLILFFAIIHYTNKSVMLKKAQEEQEKKEQENKETSENSEN